MTPNLNWKEWKRVAEAITPQVVGLFVDRVVVPERHEFPEGYLKGEWTLRLTGRRTEAALTLCVQPKACFLFLEQDKGRKAAEHATHSAFDLSLNKHLKGAQFLEIETIENERTLILWFSSQTDSEKLGLVLTMIPAQPEALLILEPSFSVLAHSRKADLPIGKVFIKPDGKRASGSFEVREALVKTPEAFRNQVNHELSLEAFKIRLHRVDKILSEKMKTHSKRVSESKTALKKVDEEPDFSHWADCLKAVLHEPPPLKKNSRRVLDFITNKEIEIPCDPKLSLKQQIERFYQQTKRHTRKREECESRMKLSEESLAQLKPLQSKREAFDLTHPDFKTLQEIEVALGLSISKGGTSSKTSTAGVGRHFLSQEGLSIWVGRSREENLELTFKTARGNDVWLHVKGRPGAHAVISLPKNKSASLETLLDAAILVVYYSGGQEWGKTEVDYTFRKYVKRIKDSTEASYTHGKTLIVDASSEKLKKLLSQN